MAGGQGGHSLWQLLPQNRTQSSLREHSHKWGEINAYGDVGFELELESGERNPLWPRRKESHTCDQSQKLERPLNMIEIEIEIRTCKNFNAWLNFSHSHREKVAAIKSKEAKAPQVWGQLERQSGSNLKPFSLWPVASTPNPTSTPAIRMGWGFPAKSDATCCAAVAVTSAWLVLIWLFGIRPCARPSLTCSFGFLRFPLPFCLDGQWNKLIPSHSVTQMALLFRLQDGLRMFLLCVFEF